MKLQSLSPIFNSNLKHTFKYLRIKIYISQMQKVFVVNTSSSMFTVRRTEDVTILCPEMYKLL